jgi:hypothetical protein
MNWPLGSTTLPSELSVHLPVLIIFFVISQSLTLCLGLLHIKRFGLSEFDDDEDCCQFAFENGVRDFLIVFSRACINTLSIDAISSCLTDKFAFELIP